MNDSKKIQDTIEILNKQIPDPRLGLPEEVFLFISRLTPMVNVDLLIKDKKGLALLSWRDD
ncbi:MAG: NUDIX hydrolase, partial [Bacteroidota bacterium]